MTSTKDRILDTASELFYSKGYVNTGLEEIINLCEIKKPTLYYYFKSKADLGLAYLEAKEEEFIGVLIKLGNKTKTAQEFFSAWTTLVKRSAREKNFHGCPFSSFAAQLKQEDKPFFEDKLNSIKTNWLNTVRSILEKNFPNRKKTADMQEAASEAMVVFVGASMLYRMTGQTEFLNAMGVQFQQIADRIKSLR